MSRARTAGPRSGVVALLSALVLCGGLGVGCSSSRSDPGPSPAAGSTSGPAPVGPSPPGPPSSPSGSTARAVPTIAEPTTTNTLPPPPAPTAPAPSTAGPLKADALPVPAGWRTVTLPGGDEEGFRGNGTWVHARDPRYAAFDAITVGCSDVTRDDYTDPSAALEGNYRKGADDGVGLVLEFDDPDAAQRYFARYRDQVAACRASGSEPRTALLGEPVATDGGRGLIDRRDYSDGRWIEVAELNRNRLTLIVLSDPEHRLNVSWAQALLDRITP